VGVEWLLGEGKRWRPYLTAAVAAAETGEMTLSMDIKRLAVAAECFHKASLIHDDIEDNDLERYGKQTLHARIGTGAALNIGDFLIGEGYRMIAETELDGHAKAMVLKAAVTAHRQLTIGQGIELDWMGKPTCLTVDQVLDIFRLKTAPAFEAALAFGGIATGIYDETNALFHDFSEALGVAYQIADDIDDFGTGQDSESPSVVLAFLCKKHPDMALEALREEIKSDAFKDEITEALDASKQCLDEYRDRAFSILDGITHRELKLLLFRVAAKILK
jgi:geranylgeranyl diphosphate synthase type II